MTGPTSPGSSLFHAQLCVLALVCLFLTIKSNLEGAYIPECVIFCYIVVELQAGTLRNSSPLPSSHQFPIAPWLGFISTPHLHVDIESGHKAHTRCQNHCGFICLCPALPGRQHFLFSSPSLTLTLISALISL